MYQVGDQVVYGTHGICMISGIETRVIDRKTVEYFVLEPADQPSARFYVPTQNQAALSKLRKLLSFDELQDILHSEEVRKNAWIADENKRKLYYRELIVSGDRAALLQMVNSLHLHRLEQSEAGRKFHMCDDNFLADAERLLGAEFSIVLGIPREQVGAYVLNAMEK